MCPNHKPQAPTDWRVSLRNSFSNWNQPLPTRTKFRLLTRNLLIRARTRSNCCGHNGEPGC
jgi:hypothetical protein